MRLPTASFLLLQPDSELFFLPNVVGTLAPAIATSFVYAVFALDSVKKPTHTPAHKQLTLTLMWQLALLAFYVNDGLAH